MWEYDIVSALVDTAQEGEEEQADIRAAPVHLEGQVINLACDEIGGAVNANILLPMLCHQLEAKYEMDISQKRAAVQQAVTALVVCHRTLLCCCVAVGSAIPKHALILQRTCMHACLFLL